MNATDILFTVLYLAIILTPILLAFIIVNQKKSMQAQEETLVQIEHYSKYLRTTVINLGEILVVVDDIYSELTKVPPIEPEDEDAATHTTVQVSHEVGTSAAEGLDMSVEDLPDMRAVGMDFAIDSGWEEAPAIDDADIVEHMDAVEEDTTGTITSKAPHNKASFTAHEIQVVKEMHDEFQRNVKAGLKGWSQEELQKELNKTLGRSHGIKMYRRVWKGEFDA